jgi:integrase
MLIPEPKFYLKDIHAKEPTMVYLQARYSINEQPQRVMLSAIDKVLPTEWDPIKQRAIISKKNLANSEINMYLDKMANCFKSIVRNLLIDDKVPTATLVKEKMEEALNLKVKIEQPKNTLYSFIELFIEESKSNKSPNTVKAYVSTFNRIKEYGIYCNKEFSFDDITIEWRVSFLRFLQQRHNVCVNTEGKYIKNIKTFLSHSVERGLNKNFSFKSKSFSKPVENVHKIFLTKEEIQKIAELDLSNDRLKDITRDYFIIACQTSLRYSDFTRIQKEHIQNDRIQMITNKTGQEVVIPISPLTRSVLEKYSYSLPKPPCNQIFNKYLKEIGKTAELNEEVSITKTIAGVKTTKVYPKYALLSSHCGRRSLISNCILEGINSNSLMLLSGHKDPKVFATYVRINQHQNATALSKASFFN